MELEFRQRHAQILSMQMQQSLRILRMSEIGLLSYIAQVAEENPLVDLEQVDEMIDAGVREFDAFEADSLDDAAEDDDGNYGYLRESSETAEDVWDMRRAAASLQDDLMFQLGALDVTPSVARVAEFLIYSLDERGYLPFSHEELAADCGTDTALVDYCIGLIQGFEPAGVGAHDLRECLMLQVPPDSLEARVIADGLDDLACGRIRSLAERYDVSERDIDIARAAIAALNPLPARGYPGDDIAFAIPEVVVFTTGRDLDVKYCGRFSEPLRIVEFPVTILGTEATDVSAYLDRHREQIRWLNQSMNMRARTLLACCRAIVAFQEPFFRGITSHPRSMTLADIARRVDMHESTVSRAMHGKYVQCERGCLALTSLFSRSVGGSDGSHTQRELCDEISRLILGEAKDKPLSDMSISKMLAEKGVRISRRTVAKYRDAMGIPAAAVRKRG